MIVSHKIELIRLILTLYFLLKLSTKRGLPWFKQIMELHGSVALTTMVLVEAINSTGIYYIADSEKSKDIKHLNRGNRSCLENVVCLIVPKEKNREEKIYSLEEVKDVQSKLMLIAGKAGSQKADVHQFNQVCTILILQCTRTTTK